MSATWGAWGRSVFFISTVGDIGVLHWWMTGRHKTLCACACRWVLQIRLGRVELPESAHCAFTGAGRGGAFPPREEQMYPSQEQLAVKGILLWDEACILDSQSDLGDALERALVGGRRLRMMCTRPTVSVWLSVGKEGELPLQTAQPRVGRLSWAIICRRWLPINA